MQKTGARTGAVGVDTKECSAESQVLIGKPNVGLSGSGRKTASTCGFKLAALC